MTTQDYSDAYEDDSENVRGWEAQDKLEPYLLTEADAATTNVGADTPASVVAS